MSHLDRDCIFLHLDSTTRFPATVLLKNKVILYITKNTITKNRFSSGSGYLLFLNYFVCLKNKKNKKGGGKETEGRKELSLILRIESKIPIIVGVIISA